MPNFLNTMNPCAFNFWSNDSLFQRDADSMVTFVLRRLGEEVLSVELTKKQIWECFEDATMQLNGMLIAYQAISNLASILGSPTGTIDPNTGNNNINLTNIYVQQTLALLDNLSAPYSALIGIGNFAESFSGSVTLEDGRQDYDLYTELVDYTNTPLYNLQPSGSVTRFQVYDVFHFAPIQYVFNSNIASNFIASGLPVESYIPDTRFYVLPLFEDVLRASMLNAAQKVRRSHYSYKLTGRNLRIYPTPNALVKGINDKLWVRIGFKMQPYPGLQNTITTSGSSGGAITVGSGSLYPNQILFGVNSPFNAPYGPVNYGSLNLWARNWIAQMTLALCTELLGRIRSKFKTFPIPGAEVTLNGEDLISQAREDKDKLLVGLKEYLDNLSYDKLQERETTKAENMVKQLQFVPVPPKYAIGIY